MDVVNTAPPHLIATSLPTKYSNATSFEGFKGGIGGIHEACLTMATTQGISMGTFSFRGSMLLDTVGWGRQRTGDQSAS